MKVLILSITAGQGHHATGQAMAEEFKRMGVECSMIDAYEYVVPLLKELVARGYILSTSYMPKAASKFYDMAVKKTEPAKDYSVVKLGNAVMAANLKEYIDEYQPDVIICTHVLSATMVNILKERNEIDAVTVGIVTDFTLHPFWEDARNLDYFVTPSELLEFQMKLKGIPYEKMLPFGIPIHPKFSKKTPKSEACRYFGLDENIPVVLLMSGSMGYGKIDKSLQKIDNLDLPLQIMAVCGKNKRVYQKISKIEFKKRINIYQYVDNVDLMMDAADCIITKPGGITSSEAMAKELPMIMTDPIPGQETRNAEFMLNSGIALYASKSMPLDEVVFSLFRYPHRIEHLRKTMALYGKKESTRKLCNFLMHQED